ncbi:MAG: outer membrane protein assembly factor BamB family protein [Pirellulales bacterium]
MKFILSILLLLVPCIQFTSADDWPHWRGVNRNDITGESSGWKQGKWDLQPLWDANTGVGSSSPLVVNGQVFSLGWRDDKDHLECLDANSGKLLWIVSYACPLYGREARGDEGLYSGPSSTPEFDQQTGYLYTLSSDGDLHCWNTQQQGKKIWSLNLYDKYQVPCRPRVGRSGHRDYGYTSSPLIYQDWLIVEVGADVGNLIAFDKRTGKQVWASQSKSPAGHNGGPVPMLVENVPCVAVHNFDGLLVVRLDANHVGETVATYDWVTSFANNIATASVDKNKVLITSAYNQVKIAKLEISLKGAKKLWEQNYASKVCTPVIHKGYVYWAWQELICLDYETGKLQWKGGRVGDAGSVIATSDDRLIVWGKEGDLMLIETAGKSTSKYTELAAKKRLLQGSDAWPHVVLANGKILCKNREGSLRCFEIR